MQMKTQNKGVRFHHTTIWRPPYKLNQQPKIWVRI